MQHAVSHSRPSSKLKVIKTIEDLRKLLEILRRRWPVVAACVAIALTAAIIFLARSKTKYEASAKLLILQQGGRPVSVATSGDTMPLIREDSMMTHVNIIRSPLIVRRALESARLSDISVDSAISRLVVKSPDESAKIIELSYRADSREEVAAVLDSVIASYDSFLQENYQANTNKVISLIVKARDDLSTEMKGLEREYLEFRKNHTGTVTDDEGRPFDPHRLEHWSQAANQAMIRAFQLRTRFEMGQKLFREGAGLSLISSALDEVKGLQGSGQDHGTSDEPETTGNSHASSYNELDKELRSAKFDRMMAERLLEHLRIEQKNAASLRLVSDEEVARAFEAEPEVGALVAERKEALAKLGSAKRVVRSSSDPSLISARRRAADLKTDLVRVWEKKKTLLLSELSRPDDGPIRQAETELLVLKAKEATLRERVAIEKDNRLQRLQTELAELLKQAGAASSPQIQRLSEEIAKLESNGDASVSGEESQVVQALLDSIERDLQSIEAVQTKIQKQLRTDLSLQKQVEINQLTESNMKSNLERHRQLFNSVVDQLKQAQLASDFGSIAAQVLNPPVSTPIRPKYFAIILLALLGGGGLGIGAAFLADLSEGRVRSLEEMRAALNLPVLGIVPSLSRDSIGSVEAPPLIAYALPRSISAERYRSIRTNLEVVRRNQSARVILISSAQCGEGKSTTSSNLAISLAQTGRKVLLIDGDLRRPTQHAIYDLPLQAGFSDLLMDEGTIVGTAQPTLVNNLHLLAAGTPVPNPAEILASGRLSSILEELKNTYDIILIDSSPLLAVSDPTILAGVADGVVLVVRVSLTRLWDVTHVIELLKSQGTPILGAVVNGVTGQSPNDGYGYGYGSVYGDKQPDESGQAALDPPVVRKIKRANVPLKNEPTQPNASDQEQKDGSVRLSHGETRST